MNRLIGCLSFCFCFCFTLLAWIPLPLRAEWNVYVAEEAGTDADGSEQAPFSTLTQARDAIRTARKSGNLRSGDPVTVWIGAGVYWLDASFELTAQDSGTEDAPVVYRAVEIGTVKICGGVTLDPESFQAISNSNVRSRLDAQVRDKVLVCDLAKTDLAKTLPTSFPPLKQSYRGVPSSPWLYCNDQPMTLARCPNLDSPDGQWATFSTAIDTGLPDPDSDDPAMRVPHGGAFEFESPRPRHWNLDDGVWLLGYWTHD